jgi:hypothetical protein
MARLLSVNVSLPRDIAWQGKIVRTAVWKAPVQGPCAVRRLNIDGDGQGDLSTAAGTEPFSSTNRLLSIMARRTRLDSRESRNERLWNGCLWREAVIHLGYDFAPSRL